MGDLQALLATDIVGSTALHARHGDAAMAANWSAHDRVARDLIHRWQGREIGRSDGIIALFPGAEMAVRFALAYHHATRRLPVPMQARIGIHAGPLRLRENGAADVALGATRFEVDGIALPTAVRVAALAEGGQTLATAATVESGPFDDVQARSLGHWRLRGLDDPIELHELLPAGEVGCMPAEVASAYRVAAAGGIWVPVRELPRRLPTERPGFVGRRDLLQDLTERFRSDTRLVTLTGPGGVGKTRLACHWAHLWLGEFPGGAWFCDLTGVRDEQELARAVAQGLGLSLPASDALRHVGRAIAGRGRCLLILDNAEQVWSQTAAAVSAWLDQADAACVLVTSRVPLALDDEVLVTVPPLPGPDAVELYRRRAAALGAEPPGGAADDDAIAALALLLDGLPLALELAAARARLMSPAAMAERMSRRFDLLVRPGQLAGRHATLRGTIDWSWQLLEPAEQVALAQLSVFRGGFDLSAAQAVLGLEPGRAQRTAVDLLQRLVDHSLVASTTLDRFGLMRSIQDYAAERLEAMGDGDHVRSRHACWYAALDEVNIVSQVCPDLDNIVEACRHATQCGLCREAVQSLVLAAARLQIDGPVHRVLDLAGPVSTMVAADVSASAAVARVVGNALASLGQVDAAARAYRQGLTAARSADDRTLTARLACALADLSIRTGARSQARALANEAVELAETLSDPYLQCTTANVCGNLALAEGRLPEALDAFRSALACARAAGHRRWEGGQLGNLGTVFYMLGQAAEAIEHFQAALDMATQIGDRQWAANARCNLGLIWLEQGDAVRAREHLTAALTAAREIGQSLLEATVMCNLGLLLLDQGQFSEATRRLREVADRAEGLGDRSLGAQSQRALARALGHQQELGLALQASERAENLAMAAGDGMERARVLGERAALRRAGGDAVGAEQDLERARALAGEMGAQARADIERLLAAGAG